MHDKAVCSGTGLPERRQHALVADRANRRLKRVAVEVLVHHQGRESLEHRYLDAAALTGSGLSIQGGQHSLAEIHGGC